MTAQHPSPESTTNPAAEPDRMTELSAGIRERIAEVWHDYTTLDPNGEDTREQWEAADEAFWQMPYGVTRRRVSSYTLAGGGPAAELRVEWEKDGYRAEIHSVTLQLSDWFVSRNEEITDEEDPVYQTAVRWVELEAESE